MFEGDVLDAMANAVNLDEVRVHSGDPGAAGVSSPTLGTGALTLPVASSGDGVRSATVPVSVSAGDTVRWQSLWLGGVFKGKKDMGAAQEETYANYGTANVTVTVDANNVA